MLIEENIALNLDDIYTNISDSINNQLIELFEGIKNPPDLSDIFQRPLNEIFKTVRNSSANCYNNAYDNAEYFENDFNILLNSIYNFNQPNIENIIQYTENDILNFVSEHQDDTNVI